MPDQIVIVQALHDDDDGAPAFVVQTGVEGVVPELLDPAPLRRRERGLRLDRVVNDDQVRTAAEDGATDRRGVAEAVRGGGNLALADPGDLELGEQVPVPWALDNGAEGGGMQVRELVGVADREDLQARIVAHGPGGVGDGDTDRLQVPRRDGDGEAPDLAVGDPLQLPADVVDVPVVAERPTWLESGEALGGERRQVLPQQRAQHGAAVSHGRVLRACAPRKP